MAGENDKINENTKPVETTIVEPTEPATSPADLEDSANPSNLGPYSIDLTNEILLMAMANPDAFSDSIAQIAADPKYTIEEQEKIKKFRDDLLVMIVELNALQDKIDQKMAELREVNKKIILGIEKINEIAAKQHDVMCEIIDGVGAVCSKKELESLNKKQEHFKRLRLETNDIATKIKEKLEEDPKANIDTEIDKLIQVQKELVQVGKEFMAEASEYIERIEDPTEKAEMKELLEDFKDLSQRKQDLITKIENGTLKDRSIILNDLMELEIEFNIKKEEAQNKMSEELREKFNSNLEALYTLSSSLQISARKMAENKILGLQKEIAHTKTSIDTMQDMQTDLSEVHATITNIHEKGLTRSDFLHGENEGDFHKQNLADTIKSKIPFVGKNHVGNFKNNTEPHVQTANGDVVFQGENGTYYYFADNIKDNGKTVITSNAEITDILKQAWDKNDPKYFGDETSYGDSYLGSFGYTRSKEGGKNTERSLDEIGNTLSNITKDINLEIDDLYEKQKALNTTKNNLEKNSAGLEASQASLANAISTNNPQHEHTATSPPSTSLGMGGP